MKMILTIILAALMLSAMSFSFANNAWAANTTVNSNNNGGSTNAGFGTTTTGGHQNTWNLGYDPNGGKTFIEKLFAGSGIGGTYGTNTTTSVGGNTSNYNNTANTSITTPGAANVGGVNVGGSALYSQMGAAVGQISMGGIWGTVTNKLLDLFGNVKLVLYVIAAFGLVGFAFMAIFGKVRWGWVCALAFGLAAVAAAGQIITYVSQTSVGSYMGDTLGANGADF